MNTFLASVIDDIGDSIHERTFEGGKKPRVFRLKEMSADFTERLFGAVDAKNPAKNIGLRNKIVAATVVDENGELALTSEEAAKLPNALAQWIQDQAFEINGLKKKEDDVKKD